MSMTGGIVERRRGIIPEEEYIPARRMSQANVALTRRRRRPAEV